MKALSIGIGIILVGALAAGCAGGPAGRAEKAGGGAVKASEAAAKHAPGGKVIAQTGIFASGKECGTFSVVDWSGGAGGRQYYVSIKRADGAETDWRPLNSYFGGRPLDLSGLELCEGDYNGDGRSDVAIGFPCGDESGESRYKIFSVDKNLRLTALGATGYRDEGYVYTAAAKKSIVFLENGDKSGILVGVAKPGGGFAPAEYLWKDGGFVFDRQTVVVADSTVASGGQDFEVKLVQTGYKVPPKPGDPGFSIERSYYYGDFELVAGGTSLPLNSCFGGGPIGFGGKIELHFADYNGDGLEDFAVAQPSGDSSETENALFTVGPGGLSRLDAAGYKTDGLVYSAENHGEFRKLSSAPGFEVTVWRAGSRAGYDSAAYIWDGGRFIFTESAPK